MNKEKVKRFVKEHKREIVIGAVCVGAGIAIGKRNTVKIKTRVSENNNRFENIYEAVDYLVKESKDQAVLWTGDNKGTVSDIADIIEQVYADRPHGLKTKCNGLIVFTK